MKMAFVLILACLPGCISSGFTKTVEVRKDAEGRIVETIITESITQAMSVTTHVQFEYLKLPDQKAPPPPW